MRFRLPTLALLLPSAGAALCLACFGLALLIAAIPSSEGHSFCGKEDVFPNDDNNDRGNGNVYTTATIPTDCAELDLRYQNIGASGAHAIAQALKHNTALKLLNLLSNDIGISGEHALAEMLKVNTGLQKLDLRFNTIGASGAAAIAEALKVNTALTLLNLNGNDIGDDGAVVISEALKVNTGLATLGLERNNIRASGATAIAEALKVNAALKTVYLGSNYIYDVAITKSLAASLTANKDPKERAAKKARQRSASEIKLLDAAQKVEL